MRCALPHLPCFLTNRAQNGVGPGSKRGGTRPAYPRPLALAPQSGSRQAHLQPTQACIPEAALAPRARCRGPAWGASSPVSVPALRHSRPPAALSPHQCGCQAAGQGLSCGRWRSPHCPGSCACRALADTGSMFCGAARKLVLSWLVVGAVELSWAVLEMADRGAGGARACVHSGRPQRPLGCAPRPLRQCRVWC